MIFFGTGKNVPFNQTLVSVRYLSLENLWTDLLLRSRAEDSEDWT